MTERNEVPNFPYESTQPLDRSDFESRVDGLEISRAMHDLHIRSLLAEITSGKEKFHDITDILAEHTLAIALLQTMKNDITEIKACVTNLKGLELQRQGERKGAWKIVVGISAAISFVIQAAIQYFTMKH